MRSIREIYEKREAGLYPCQYPGCREYGRLADYKHGVVCENHTAEGKGLYQYGDHMVTLDTLKSIEYEQG
jgi:hypothetical protein